MANRPQIIAANKIDAIPVIESGGKVNPNGNMLLVDTNKNHINRDRISKGERQLISMEDLESAFRDYGFLDNKDIFISFFTILFTLQLEKINKAVTSIIVSFFIF